MLVGRSSLFELKQWATAPVNPNLGLLQPHKVGARVCI